MSKPLDQLKIKYAKDYLEATQEFHKEVFQACQHACKYNLTYDTLPPYWKLKNYLLYISASDDCPDSEDEQEALRELRESLDQVRQWQDEDRPVRASGKQDVVEEHETGNADIQVEQENTTMDVENPVEAEDTPDIYEPSKTTPSEKVDPHAKYGSLNHHPSLAIRDKLWHGLRSSSRKAQNVAFNAGSTLQKQPSISELRRSLQQREQMEDEA